MWQRAYKFRPTRWYARDLRGVAFDQQELSLEIFVAQNFLALRILCYTHYMITKEQVLQELKKVVDPELNINIVDLGLIYGVGIDQKKGKVDVTMTLTTPGCPLSIVFEEWVPAAVKNIKGVKDVKINLVWEPPWDPDKISDEAKESLGIIQ